MQVSEPRTKSGLIRIWLFGGAGGSKHWSTWTSATGIFMSFYFLLLFQFQSSICMGLRVLSIRKNTIWWPFSSPVRSFAYSAHHRNRPRILLPPPPLPSSYLSNLPPTPLNQTLFRSHVVPLYRYGWYITRFPHRMVQNADGVWFWKPYRAAQLGSTFRLQGFRNAIAFLNQVMKISLQERVSSPSEYYILCN